MYVNTCLYCPMYTAPSLKCVVPFPSLYIELKCGVPFPSLYIELKSVVPFHSLYNVHRTKVYSTVLFTPHCT